eukprot:9316096-Lingulodinium_polyedra.AAC.1
MGYVQSRPAPVIHETRWANAGPSRGQVVANRVQSVGQPWAKRGSRWWVHFGTTVDQQWADNWSSLGQVSA